MSITCQVCGTLNPDGTTYCEGCGVELTGSAAPTEATAEATTPAHTPDTAPEVVAAAAPAEPVTSSEASSSAEVAPAEVATSSEASVTDWDATPSSTPAPELPVPETHAAEAPAPASQEAAPAEAAPAAAVAPATSPEATNPAATSPAAPSGEAKLGIKKFGALSGESIPLQGERLVVGRFDASSGPVDIDLSGMGGQEHISRRHAELYREGGVWHVRDLGSTNGVYIKRKGESAFSPRLQEPAALADGDELAFGNLMFTFQQG